MVEAKEMNAVLVHGQGKFGPGKAPVPVPAANQVLIKVDSAPINPSDLGALMGMYRSTANLKLPFVAGFEGSGTVVATGDDEQAKALMGKQVAFTMDMNADGSANGGGSYAEYCATNWRSAMPLPDNLALEDGACHFVNPLTALCLVHRA